MAAGLKIYQDELKQLYVADGSFMPLGAACEVADRTHYLLGISRDGVRRMDQQKNIRLDGAELRAWLVAQLDAVMPTGMGPAYFRMDPAVTALQTRLAPGTLRTLCLDLDVAGHAAQGAVPMQYEALWRSLWADLRRHSATELPDEPRVVYISGGTYPDKPQSYHVFFPEYHVGGDARMPRALKDAINAWLTPAYGLDADTAVAGLKWTFSSKPIKQPDGSYATRRHVMYPVYYRNTVYEGPEFISWDHWAWCADPHRLPSDASMAVTFVEPQAAPGQQQQQRVQGVRHQGLPDLPYVQLAWEYYRHQFSPTARASAVSEGVPGQWLISTYETENLVCHHAGNNHYLVITESRLKVVCHGGQNSNRFKVTMAQVREYLQRVEREAARDRGEWTVDGFLDWLLASGAGVTISTRFTRRAFQASGDHAPPWAVPNEFLGSELIISPVLFGLLRDAGASQEALIAYVNLGIGVTGGQFLTRGANGAVDTGVTQGALSTTMLPFQALTDKGKLVDFFGVWLRSPLRAGRQSVRVAMDSLGQSPNEFLVLICPSLTLEMAQAHLQRMNQEFVERLREEVATWWGVFTTQLTCNSADDPLPFKEWMTVWVAETLMGKELVKTYLMCYDPEGGVGKSLLKCIITGVLGEHLVLTPSDLNQVLGNRWNMGRIGRRLIALDDTGTAKEAVKATFNQMITEGSFDVEFKGGRQGVRTANFASVLVASNSDRLYATTDKDRRVCFCHGGRYYGPHHPADYYPQFFGPTKDSFLAYGYDYLVPKRPGAFTAHQCMLLDVLAREHRRIVGAADVDAVTYLRQRVESNDLRGFKRIEISIRAYEEVGEWIVHDLNPENGGHLFHLTKDWSRVVQEDVLVHDGWPRRAGETNDHTDASGRIVQLPARTLWGAFRVYMRGRDTRSQRQFTEDFIKAFNGISAILDGDDVQQRYAINQPRARGFKQVTPQYQEVGHTWLYQGGSDKGQVRALVLDYSAFEAYFTRDEGL